MLKKFNCIETVFILIMFVVITIGITVLPIPAEIKWAVFFIYIIFLIMFITNCVNTEDYNKKRYNPIQYAKLQSEKYTYSLLSAFLALMSSLLAICFSNTQTTISGEICEQVVTYIKVFIFILCMNFLLLSSIAYRHLIYAIYMQEAKKRFYDIQFKFFEKQWKSDLKLSRRR